MGFGPMYSAPDPSLGYYRGAPTYREGKNVGKGIMSRPAGQGTAPAAGGGTWQPTVKYMLALVIAEIVVFGLLGKLAGI